MDKPKGKPDLAILIGHSLAKKGKSKVDPLAEDEEAEVSGDDEKRDHVKMIAGELLSAIESKDEDAVTDLLLELLECGKEDY